MTKQLILFIQSDNPGLYINILTHCCNKYKDVNVCFAINGGAVGNIFKEKEKIKRINDRLDELCTTYPDQYKLARAGMPPPDMVEKRIEKIQFANPDLSIKDLKNKFRDTDELIIDISGCNKKVSTDIISSYILNGIKHICYFELDNIVYDPDWKKKNLSKDYHDLCKDNLLYYEYVDFSETGTTIKSFDRMRSQGKLIKFLSIISIILGFIVIVLIQQQQNNLAQYATIVLTLVTGIGLVNDIFGITDRLK